MHLMQLDGGHWTGLHSYVYDRNLTYIYEDINEKGLGRVHM